MADEGENRTVALAVERINQMLKMLEQERASVQRERDLLQRLNQMVLDSLEQMREHWQTSQRAMAAASRLEGNLREGVADAHRLVDKLPGRRMR